LKKVAGEEAMRKIIASIFCLLFLVFSGSAGLAESFYYTYTVTAVTETTITLQRTKGDKTYTAVIAKARRPYLKVGDRVRYNRIEDRLRRTLPPK
jgi:hypothetical protein